MMTDKREASAFIIKEWKDRGKSIVDYIETLDTSPKPLDKFWEHCTACGGDWGAMILTGIKELYPDLWDLIPDHMGIFAFSLLCEVLNLLGYED